MGKTITRDMGEKILPFLKKMNLYINFHMAGVKRANIRLQKLWDNNLWVEAMILHCQIVEYAIRFLLKEYGVKREILHIRGEVDPTEAVAKLKDDDIKKAPLGTLIGELKNYMGHNNLTLLLDDLNQNFRKDFVHHVFFTTDANLEDALTRAKAYFSDDKFKNLIKSLNEAEEKIRLEMDPLLEIK